MYRRIGTGVFSTTLAGLQIAASGEFRHFVPLAALAMLLLIIHLPAGSGTKPSDLSAGIGLESSWSATFLLIMGLSALLVFCVNPEGRLPWNQRKSYVGLLTRIMKPQLYKKLPHTPEIILFGSSVSFTMPAEYLEDRWGLDAFNMSISGGSPSDFLHLLNFIIKNSPDQHIASAVTMELLWRDMRLSEGTQMPMRMVPYMDRETGTAAVLDVLDSPFQLNSVLNAILTVLLVEPGWWECDVEFIPGGTAIRLQNELPLADYQKNRRNEISLHKRVMSCRQLTSAVVAYIEEIVAMSEKYHFAVIFYAPPINSEFYTMAGVKPRRFESCRRLLDGSMRGLARRHPNVFFSDLIDYQPISALGRQVFLDPRHLTREGNILLLQAIEPEIEQALKWVGENRQHR